MTLIKAIIMQGLWIIGVLGFLLMLGAMMPKGFGEDNE